MGGRRYMVKGKKNHTMVPTAYAELVYPSCPPVVQCCFDKINVNQLAPTYLTAVL